jgi:hypothetical protein
MVFVRVVYDVRFLLLALIAAKVESLLGSHLFVFLGFVSKHCAEHFAIVQFSQLFVS